MPVINSNKKTCRRKRYSKARCYTILGVILLSAICTNYALAQSSDFQSAFVQFNEYQKTSNKAGMLKIADQALKNIDVWPENNEQFKVVIYYMAAYAYYQNGKYKQAVEFCDKVEKISEKDNVFYVGYTDNVYKIAALAYMRLHNFQKSYHYSSLFITEIDKNPQRFSHENRSDYVIVRDASTIAMTFFFDADSLWARYVNNAIEANKNITGQQIVFEGKIERITQRGNMPILAFLTNNQKVVIGCAFDKSQVDKLAQLKSGQKVGLIGTVKEVKTDVVAIVDCKLLMEIVQ